MSGYCEPDGNTRYTRDELPPLTGWRLECREGSGILLHDWNYSVAAVEDFPFPEDGTTSLGIQATRAQHVANVTLRPKTVAAARRVHNAILFVETRRQSLKGYLAPCCFYELGLSIFSAIAELLLCQRRKQVVQKSQLGCEAEECE